jgi:hypothetical protein
MPTDAGDAMGRQGFDRPYCSICDRARKTLAPFCFACLTASLLLGAYCLHGRREPGGDLAEAEVAERKTIGMEVLEERCSPGFPEVATLVAEAPEAPSWEAFRRLLEGRGDVDVWYGVKVRWLLDDGGSAELTYMRRPYLIPTEYDLFLRFVREGRLDPLEGWVAGLDLMRDGVLEDEAPLAAAILGRAARRKPREAPGS